MLNNQNGDPNSFISVDKLILFGILYTPSSLSEKNGNLSKGLLFYHLINGEKIAESVPKNSKKLKQLMLYIFEFCQATLESDPDGRQRLYFREPVAYFSDINNRGGGAEKEQIHQRITEWLYQDFLWQLFANRESLSCIQFIERLACKFSKDRDPNRIEDDEIILLEYDSRAVVPTKKDHLSRGMNAGGQPQYFDQGD